MGDLPTSEASILPSAEVELDLLQIHVHMGVLPTSRREIQIMGM